MLDIDLPKFLDSLEDIKKTAEIVDFDGRINATNKAIDDITLEIKMLKTSRMFNRAYSVYNTAVTLLLSKQYSDEDIDRLLQDLSHYVVDIDLSTDPMFKIMHNIIDREYLSKGTDYLEAYAPHALTYMILIDSYKIFHTMP